MINTTKATVSSAVVGAALVALLSPTHAAAQDCTPRVSDDALIEAGKLVMSTNGGLNPSGVGPPESARDGGGGLPTVATPTISPLGGSYVDSVDVTLSTTPARRGSKKQVSAARLLKAYYLLVFLEALRTPSLEMETSPVFKSASPGPPCVLTRDHLTKWGYRPLTWPLREKRDTIAGARSDVWGPQPLTRKLG